MKKDTYKKYFILITYTMVLALVMINIKEILSILWGFIKLLSPLWIGIALAFVLNVPMSIIERELFGRTDKKIRIFSLTMSIAVIVLLLLVLFVWVIPDFIDSATYLLGQVPSLIEGLNNLLLNAFKNTDLSSYITNMSGSAEVTTILSGAFKGIINNFSSFLSNFVAFVLNLITGIIISIYFLLEKEHLISTMKSLLNKIFDKKMVKKMNKVFSLANKSFHDFITYQCLECLILGILMFIAFIIFRFPYALTIAFLTTITAIVPIFGATVACIIGAILIGTVSIKQAIVFIIVFQVIQQIENNIIYPRVVGKHVGLPPVVTILAIFIGGELAGFFGMIVCIPLTSILYSLFWTKIEDKNIKREEKILKQV